MPLDLQAFALWVLLATQGAWGRWEPGWRKGSLLFVGPTNLYPLLSQIKMTSTVASLKISPHLHHPLPHLDVSKSFHFYKTLKVSGKQYLHFALKTKKLYSLL